MVRPTEHLKFRNQVIVAASAFISLIIIGTVLFHSLEDWTYIQSFYFSVVTLTTVGYGDLTPTSDATRLFTAFYILFGVTIAVSSVSIIGSGYIRRRTNKRASKK